MRVKIIFLISRHFHSIFSLRCCHQCEESSEKIFMVEGKGGLIINWWFIQFKFFNVCLLSKRYAIFHTLITRFMIAKHLSRCLVDRPSIISRNSFYAKNWRCQLGIDYLFFDEKKFQPPTNTTWPCALNEQDYSIQHTCIRVGATN